MTIRKQLFLAVLLTGLALLGSPARGASNGCSDTKATQVDIAYTQQGSTERCGLGIVIFGFGGALIGSKCSQFEVKTPAHQICEGEPAEGMNCEFETAMTVEQRECHCGGLVIPGIEVGIPTTCVCDDTWGYGGTVEDFKTTSCN